MPTTAKHPVPGFHVPSPAQRPKQAHGKTENAGDTLAFQSEHHDAKGDQNVWAFYTKVGQPKSGIHFIFGHWGTMKKDGYTHIVRANGHGVRKLNVLERHRPKRLWSYGAAMRCRKGASVHSGSPMNLQMALTHGKQVRFQVIPELKDPKFGRDDVAHAFVEKFAEHDYACWPKALVNLAAFKAKVQAFGRAGVTLAAIGGKKAQKQKRATVARARAQRWAYQPHEW